jgi:type I restriction enzyme, S subunit
MTAAEPSPLLPRLRFAEFSDRPGWDEMPLSSASDVNPSNDGLPESFIYIDLESVTSGVLVERKEIARDIAPSRAQRLLRRKDIIYQTVRPYQRNNLFFDIDDEREYVASTGYAQLRAHGCPEFLYQLLHTDSFVNSVLAQCTGSNYPAINSSDLARIHVALPRRPEQQKIADCLGSLDELIAAEGRKLGALRQHKKGMMQQLFPQPGETVPLRGNQSDWIMLDLSEVAFFQEGPGIMAADFCSEGVPLVRLSGLAGTAATLDGCNYLNPAKVAQKWEHFRLAAGDLLISTSASFGRVSIVTEVAAGAVFYTGLVRLRSIDKRLSDCYLKTYLESPDFLRQAEAHAVGGGIKHFGPTHLHQMQIQVPPLAEQQRIADCLSSLDACIDGQSRKLGTLKRHKHGLLQQLFPSLEGV